MAPWIPSYINFYSNQSSHSAPSGAFFGAGGLTGKTHEMQVQVLPAPPTVKGERLMFSIFNFFKQKKDYWIQIELDPRGSNTSAVQINLAKVQRNHILRDNKQISEVRVRYDDEVLCIPKYSVESYLTHWKKYQAMLHTDAEAQPSAIAVASEGGDLYRLNPKRR
jgi:hypothetical protein